MAVELLNTGEDAPVKKPLVSNTVPKADMHVHISLALSVETFLRRSKNGRVEGAHDLLKDKTRRYYPTMQAHHRTYEALRHLTATEDELAEVTQTYLERIAKEGAIYAELQNTFRDEASFPGQMAAIAAGIDAAKTNFGIEARIVATSIRDYRGENAAHAEKAARHLARINTNM